MDHKILSQPASVEVDLQYLGHYLGPPDLGPPASRIHPYSWAGQRRRHVRRFRAFHPCRRANYTLGHALACRNKVVRGPAPPTQLAPLRGPWDKRQPGAPVDGTRSNACSLPGA